MKRITSLLSIGILFLIASFSVNAEALRAIHFSKEELSNIEGHYSTVYGYVYIQVRGRYVSTNIDGKHIQLIKKSNGRFYPKYKLLKVIPVNLGDMSFKLNNKKGKQQILMFEQNKSAKTVAQKFTPKQIPSLWKQRLGKYKATLVKGRSKIKQIRLAVKQGVLVAYINKISNPYPLLALSGNKIFSPSAGHNRKQSISISSRNKDLNLTYNNNNLILKKF